MNDDMSTSTDSSLSPGAIDVFATVTLRGSDIERCLTPSLSLSFLAPPPDTPTTS